MGVLRAGGTRPAPTEAERRPFLLVSFYTMGTHHETGTIGTHFEQKEPLHLEE